MDTAAHNVVQHGLCAHQLLPRSAEVQSIFGSPSAVCQAGNLYIRYSTCTGDNVQACLLQLPIRAIMDSSNIAARLYQMGDSHIKAPRISTLDTCTMGIALARIFPLIKTPQTIQ